MQTIQVTEATGLKVRLERDLCSPDKLFIAVYDDEGVLFTAAPKSSAAAEVFERFKQRTA